MTRLETLPADSKPADVVAALARDGAVILRDAMAPDTRARIMDEAWPFIAGTKTGRDPFSGFQTTRTGGLVTRCPSVRDVVMDPRVLAVCDGVLLPYCQRYQLHLTQMIGIGPGQPVQMLHRDRQVWGDYLRGLEPQLNLIWAMTDFTAENGATRVVPGSQLWGWEREPQPHEICQAEMSAGSALIYTGSVIHGGGENRSDSVRYGLNVDYSLGWLRQEENQYLSCPPSHAKHFPKPLQDLVGYSMGDHVLGYFSPPEPVPGMADTLTPEKALELA